MQGIQHFLAMGGYAAFVWSAYGLAAVILVGNVFYSKLRSRRQQRLLNKVSS